MDVSYPFLIYNRDTSSSFIKNSNINNKYNTNNIVLKNRIIISGTTAYLSNISSKNTFLLGVSTKDSLKNTFYKNIFLDELSKDGISKNKVPNSVFRSIFFYIENATTGKTEKTIEKIKNSNLLLISKLPENFSDESISSFLKNTKLPKKYVFQKNNAVFKVIVSLRKIITFKNVNLPNRRRKLSSKDSSNIAESSGNRTAEYLGKRVFSNYNHLSNDLRFLNRIYQLHSTLFSKACSSSYTQNFVEIFLKTNFLALRKRNEVKIENAEHNFDQSFNLLKSRDLGKVRSRFKSKKAFPSYLLSLPVDNLVFPGKRTNFSIFVNQMSIINKKTLISSFPDFDSGNKEGTSVFEKRKMLLFTVDNEISGLEHGKCRNFYVNTENFIFRTQSDIEQKIEEKIEQKIEQVKKVTAEAHEEVSEQSRGICSRTGESQKQQMYIDHISDQVFKLMENRLKIERERRGIL